MARVNYVCQECGHKESKWMGCCSSCQTWNSFVETSTEKKSKIKEKLINQINNGRSKPLSVSRIENNSSQRMVTGISEFDKTVGGGLCLGSLTLVGGDPGIGKSTLLIQVAERITKLYKDRNVIYISGEESQYQVAQRCQRLGISSQNLLILHETSWQNIEKILSEVDPVFIVLDSIQTTVSHNSSTGAGSSSQVKEVTYEFMNYCKSKQVTGFIIGHVTKDGGIAGPKVLEHMVDTVISFEGNKYSEKRMLRVLKNRFGNTNEIGLLRMNENGLSVVHNPFHYLVGESCEADIDNDSCGKAMSCLLEGGRPLLAEIQALTIDSQSGNPGRTTQGYDYKRLILLVAIIEKHLKIPLGQCDIYINVTGDLKIKSKESDLAVVASLLSSHSSKRLGNRTIFLGELSLSGEVVSIPQVDELIREVYACGYNKIILPESSLKTIKYKPESISYIGVKKINDLVEYIFQ